MTLLELLTVIVIFSILMGLTVYFVQGIGSDLGVDASANQVASQLRGVHQMARSNAIPGWVLLDFNRNSVAMLVGETVGEWHFEEAEPEKGAFGRTAKLSNAPTVPGRIGHGVRLTGSVACGDVPVFTVDQGFAIEFWYLRRRGRGSGRLCSVGNLIDVSIRGNGTLEAKAGGVTLSSGQAQLPDETWCRVQLVHSGRDVRFILNRAQVDRAAGKMFWTRPEPLTIGDASSGPGGIIDEFRISLIVPREAYTLPRDTRFALPAPDPEGADLPPPPGGELLIAFDAEGRLDPSVQQGEVRVAVQTRDERKIVVVGLGGNVRTVDATRSVQPAPPSTPGETKAEADTRH